MKKTTTASKTNVQKKILFLNGSPSGKTGNCAVMLNQLIKTLPKSVAGEVVSLKTEKWSSALKNKILDADALVVSTGTYWDSWGSPLQKLLEDMTELEGHPKLLGKPTAVLVLMHSVGGKGVLSRLQGVLSTFGCLIPPMSGMVYSLVSEIAMQRQSSHAMDFWQREDGGLILENLIAATEIQVQWKEWPVDKKDPKRKWLK